LTLPSQVLVFPRNLHLKRLPAVPTTPKLSLKNQIR